MIKRWFGVLVVTAAALGCAMAAENPAPELTPPVTSAPPVSTVVPAAATSRKPATYREPAGGPTSMPMKKRAAGSGVIWSLGEATNASRLAATPLPNDIPAVRALHEQIRETLSVVVRRQVDMQVAASDQMNRERDYRSKLRNDDPELLKLQQRLATLNSEREALNRQIDERFNQDNQYQKLTRQRGEGLQKLRDMTSLTAILREKMTQLEQRQAELERQNAAAATNQNQVQAEQAPTNTPAVVITRQ